MTFSTKKWQSTPKDQRVEIGLVQVDIAAQTSHHDHSVNLILKRAKDALKDALVATAERRGGKLSSWKDDSGTFMFPIDSPDSLDNCCLAAIQMLYQLPLTKQDAQLPAELEPFIKVRIACDAGEITYGPDADKLPDEFLDEFKKYKKVVSAENEVTITARVFRQLNNSLKSTFVKWKHSNELGVDIYSTAETPGKLGLAAPDLSLEQVNPAAGDQRTAAGRRPAPSGEWLVVSSNALKSRKALAVGAVVLFSLAIFAIVRFWPSSPPPVALPQYAEMVQSDAWRSWRKQVHEKLSASEVPESTLADALIKLPSRPEEAAAALRRDQAIADVIMSYKNAKDALWKRFGIEERNFLGTGLSKPYTAKDDYVAASVHEYLIPNLPDSDDDVWTWKRKPNETTMTVRTLIESEQNDQKNKPVQRIAERVSRMDDATPAVIRFALLPTSVYKQTRTLGHPDRYRVFASNLAEVWNMSVKDAAVRSGHTFTVRGDESLYVWVFVPKYPTQVVPATWHEVLTNLPTWLSERNRN